MCKSENLNKEHKILSTFTLISKTYRFVFLHATFGMWSAVAWLATEIVDARLFRCTIRVSDATDGLDRLDWFAHSAAAADVALRADAQYGAYGQRRHDLTFRGRCAWFENGTRFLALVIDTGEGVWTVGIVDAFRLRFIGLAEDVGVSVEAIVTLAQRVVVLCDAVSAVGTLVLVVTWVEAHAVDLVTELVVWTVGVAQALDGSALHERVSDIAVGASALGLVCSREAFSIWRAWVIDEARADAVSIDARLVVIALGVASASDSITKHIGVALKVGLAAADWFVSHDRALAVLRAVAWTSACAGDASKIVAALVVVRAAFLLLDDSVAFAAFIWHHVLGT
jgi:hypothetical protein